MQKTNITAQLKISDVPMKTTASADGTVQPDLLYVESILVSTGENDNDDVFLAEEMWAARSSPVYKPMDWEHNTGRELRDRIESTDKHRSVVDDNQIIGVMYATTVIDKDGNAIPDSVAASLQAPPEHFHIVNKGVVYKYLFPTVAARIARDANAGKLFVSMEAWYKSYDYKVGNKIVARNSSTAFLDGHLRANGGVGQYKGEKVSRILRGITFGGIGFVANPANKDSVIMSITNASEDARNSGELSIAKEAQAMSDGNDMKVQILELEKSIAAKDAELVAAKTEAEKLSATVDTFSVALSVGSENIAKLVGDEVVAKIAASKPTEYLAVIHDAVASVLEKSKEKQAKLDSALAQIAELEKQKLLAEVNAKVSEIFASVEQTETIVALRSRVASLAANMTAADRDAYLEDTRIMLGMAAKPPMAEDKKKPEDSEDSCDANSDTELLEHVKTEAAVLPAGAPAEHAEDSMVEKMKGLASLLLACGKEAQGGK